MRDIYLLKVLANERGNHERDVTTSNSHSLRYRNLLHTEKLQLKAVTRASIDETKVAEGRDHLV